MTEDVKHWLDVEMGEEWESLHDIANHYQEYNRTRRRKLPQLTKEIIVDLDAALTTFWSVTRNEGWTGDELVNKNMLFHLGAYLSEGKDGKINVSKITLSGKNGAFNIESEYLIRLMLSAIIPTIEEHAERPKPGAPLTKLWNAIAMRARVISELKRKGITNEFLWESFKRVNEKETPGYESFVKTLQRGLKAGKKYL